MRRGACRRIDYLLPIILTTIVSKWLGDQINEGLYHTALHLKGMPFLDTEGNRRATALQVCPMLTSRSGRCCGMGAMVKPCPRVQTAGDVMGRELQVSHDLQLQSLWMIPTAAVS